MPQIILPEPKEADIYSFGFGKNLNKALLQALPQEQETGETTAVYDSLSGGISAAKLVSGSNIGGWTITPTALFAGSGSAKVGFDARVTDGDDIRIYAGNDTPATAPFRVTEAGAVTATNASFAGGTIGGFTIGASTISATNLTLTSGAANAANIVVGTGATAAGLNSANAGGDIAIWAGATFANRATAPFRVEADGDITATSATITGALTTGAGSSLDGQYLTAGSVTSAAANLALRGWTFSVVFSVLDNDTVQWTAGTFTASDGTDYSINAGDTGNMTARSYIYLDIAVSTTAFQITTTAATAVGNGKVLVATAINGLTEASFQMFGGSGGLNIDAANIVTGSITANEIQASTITGGKIAANTIEGSNISTMNISGKNATFDTGTIGGFNMAATTLSATNLTLTSGAANVANISVGTGANLAGMNAGNSGTDIAFWAGDTYANRATAPYRVNLQGDVTMTSSNIDIAGYFFLLGSVTLGGSQATLTIQNISAFTTALVYVYGFLDSSNVTVTMQFNNDVTSGNYRWRNNKNGTYSTSSSSPSVQMASATGNSLDTTTPSAYYAFIHNNRAADKKIVNGFGMDAAAAASPDDLSFTGIWTNTADNITRLDVAVGTGNFLANSKMIILGKKQ